MQQDELAISASFKYLSDVSLVIMNVFTFTVRESTSDTESGVCRRQILTSKVDPTLQGLMLSQCRRQQ